MKEISLNEVLYNFNIESVIEEYGNVHINDTYLIHTQKLVLQRINTNIFKNPYELMENISYVTEFIRKKVLEEGGDAERETLTILKTKDGKLCFKYDNNNVFRLYKFISKTKTIENDKTPKILYNAGIGFGKFQRRLNDFPVEKLHETIADFHNTPKRVEDLKTAIKEDKAGRVKSVGYEIEFALNHSSFAGKVTDAIQNGLIPIRVTHNDTKINNILFDEKSNEAVAVIDLDTVMPGSMLYDFGDALRMGASTAAEDETDLSKVHIDTESFKSFTDGYLHETKSILIPAETELFPFAVKLMTYECGIRFLTDYLNGDVYFKIHRPNHNLDRARNQFKLVSDIEKKESVLNLITKDLLKGC